MIIIHFVDIDECANITLNICEQRCVNIPGDFTCDCNSGFDLNADGITCSGKLSIKQNDLHRKQHP